MVSSPVILKIDTEKIEEALQSTSSISTIPRSHDKSYRTACLWEILQILEAVELWPFYFINYAGHKGTLTLEFHWTFISLDIRTKDRTR